MGVPSGTTDASSAASKDLRPAGGMGRGAEPGAALHGSSPVWQKGFSRNCSCPLVALTPRPTSSGRLTKRGHGGSLMVWWALWGLRCSCAAAPGAPDTTGVLPSASL